MDIHVRKTRHECQCYISRRDGPAYLAEEVETGFVAKNRCISQSIALPKTVSVRFVRLERVQTRWGV